VSISICVDCTFRCEFLWEENLLRHCSLPWNLSYILFKFVFFGQLKNIGKCAHLDWSNHVNVSYFKSSTPWRRRNKHTKEAKLKIFALVWICFCLENIKHVLKINIKIFVPLCKGVFQFSFMVRWDQKYIFFFFQMQVLLYSHVCTYVRYQRKCTLCR
jgi:hypothetical protein